MSVGPGCLACTEKRRDLRALARLMSWKGRPTDADREKLRTLRAAITACTARGHTVDVAIRGGHAAAASKATAGAHR